MATLVLSTVGRALGGPIGGAVGAILGQAIDARLFRHAAREGPRLADLSVQTSSYGTPLPQLFGTMRVAGTVIWSTDLIETRNSQRGGKGRPTTNSYSYSASFAVALSARPIVAVRRIWAEGKLVRGAAGDWKTQTGFRLHLGSEDQPVDPLIAAAMGATPAYRGMAYAVFEGLQLADFGNRIPSLTFEVVADPAAVPSGVIAATIAPEVTAQGGMPLDGFAASGANVRGVLDTLALLDGGWWRSDGARLVRQTDTGAAVPIADAGMAAGGRAPRRRRIVAALASVPREVAVAHHDPARDYQVGVQRMRRPGPGERIDRVELPAVIGSTAAKGVAAALLVRGEIERTRRQVSLGWEALGIAPGAIVSLNGEAGRWRVASSSISGVLTTLTLLPIGAMPVAGTATSGAFLPAADLTIGRTMLAAAELPGLGEAPLSLPRLTVVACGSGPGWRQAAMLYSLDEGASWSAAPASAAPGVIGTVEAPPAAAASGRLFDRTSEIVVTLARDDMMLGDADAVMCGQGGNLALLGDELIQFATATPLGGGRWRLTGLCRGVRGSEAAIAVHRLGERFVLIEAEAVTTIDLPVAAIGRRLRLLANGVGDAAPVETVVTITGASVAPPAPVHGGASFDVGGGVTLRWVRRSRTGWNWRDGVDVPLAEEAERYRLAWTAADGPQTVVTHVPVYRFDAASQPPDGTIVEVVQLGTLAASLPLTIIVGEAA